MFSLKKILLIGFVAILLITIPVTMFVLQQQQEIRSQAQASTSLSFTPLSTTANPYQVKVDDTVSLDVMVNPNGNSISFVRLEIQYDPTKLAPPEDVTTLFTQNKTAFPVTNQPVVNDTDSGKVIISVSVDTQATTDITTLTKVGTLQFKAIEKTETPTQVVYGIQTQVLSKAEGDQASEDVLLPSGKSPAIIAVVEGTEPSPSVSPTESITPSPSITVTTSPEPTISPSPTVAATNVAPACVSLVADVTSGTAPLTVNFTAIGSDTDGTVEKITFNLGDTNVASVTEGLSLSSASGQLAHTYTSGGIFTASTVITDNSSGTSTNVCSQTITVTGPTATPGAGTPTTAPTVAVGTGTDTGTDTGTVITEAPTPTIADPGPGAAFIGLGAFFTVLSLIGAIMFFAL